MKKYKIASLLMFIHGAFMEIGGCLALIPVFVIGSDKFKINQMIISKNPQFTGISARQQLEFTTHLLLTD